MGNPGLTALWGITGDDPLSLEDLTAPVKPVKDLEYFNRELQKELDLQEERKQALTGDKEPTQRQLADDAEWAAIEDVSVALASFPSFFGGKNSRTSLSLFQRKASLCWRALRLLAPDELANFSKVCHLLYLDIRVLYSRACLYRLRSPAISHDSFTTSNIRSKHEL